MLTTDGSPDLVAFSFQCHVADCAHLTGRYKLCLWNFIVSIEKLRFLHTHTQLYIYFIKNIGKIINICYIRVWLHNWRNSLFIDFVLPRWCWKKLCDFNILSSVSSQKSQGHHVQQILCQWFTHCRTTVYVIVDPLVTAMCYLHYVVNQLNMLIIDLWFGLYLKY
jgi:hypothetical protein